ncbi:MAG: hypothetical protein ACRELD_00855 [Longimicrobiales bacterium]
MTPASPLSTLRLPESIRRRLDVATATASEALMETHALYGLHIVMLLRDFIDYDEAVDRYLDEMNLMGAAASTARTRILVALEEAERLGDGEAEAAPDEAPAGDAPDSTDPRARPRRGRWRRFRPDVVYRGIRARARRQEELDSVFTLGIAQAEEALLQTHIENALDFAVLLEQHMDVERSIEHYIDEIGLGGCRAQTVLQRAVCRLADAQLPRPTERRSGAGDTSVA